MKTLITFIVVLFFAATAYGNCVNAGYEKYNKKGVVKGDPATGGSPAKGVNYLQIKDIDQIFLTQKQNDYVFIDTRPADLFKECTIKGAINMPYKFAGKGKLKKSELETMTKNGKKIVFFCNSLKCYRSLNASIESKCTYGLNDGSVHWYGRGTAGLATSPNASKTLVGNQCNALKILLNGKAKR